MHTNFLQRIATLNLRVILAVLLLSIGIVLGAAAPMWSVVDSPNGTRPLSNSFNGIACVSSSDCWAVGSYNGSPGSETLIEHWNGTAWLIVSSPNDGTSTFLNGVTCSTSSNCWAVGVYYDGNFYHTLTEHWDGTAWSIVSSANTSGTQNNSLSAVTCVSSSDCWAVGYYNGSTAQTLAEHWDGTAWSIVTSADTSPAQYDYLSGVTCASSSDCWAVGYAGTQTLIEHWNGTSWSIVSSPNTGGTNYLNGVSCSSSSDCWAVGYYYNGSTDHTLIEHWDGAAWSIIASPNASVARSNELRGVTCSSSSNCWAVGLYYDGRGSSQTLIEHWNGISWSIVSSPNTSGTNYLNGVTCSSSSDCWAVGYYYNGSTNQTLIEHWDGTAWAVVISSNIRAPSESFLYGMTCASSSDCWAVGDYDNGTTVQTLIEHWDGASWLVTSSPNTSTARGNILYGVTCAASSDCWAVGYWYGPNSLETLIEHWDGKTWSIVSSPNNGATDNLLYGVTCASSSDCWAVGFYNNNAYRALIEHWDGTAWSIVNSPNVDPLSGVTCSSSSDCWAVGSPIGSGGGATLIEHWNGTSWSIVSSPNIGMTAFLNGVTCASSSDCWVVGVYYDGNFDRTLTEHWDGTAWSIVSSANTSGTQNNFLNAVTCASSSDCWAGGYFNGGGNVYLGLTEHWDGAAWSIVSSPNLTQYNFLKAVACATPSDCWAVGYDGSIGRTLIEHYGPVVQLTGVVSRKMHGDVGAFDINLPLTGTPGVECRVPGHLPGAAAGDHQLVFTFSDPVSIVGGASVTGGTSSVANSYVDGADTHNYIVNLAGTTNAQYLTVRLNNIRDSAGDFSSVVSVSMGVLIGDTTGNGTVNASDIAQTQSQSGQPVSASNFREDVTVNGTINSSDIALVQSKSGTGLPTSGQSATSTNSAGTVDPAPSPSETHTTKTRKRSSSS